MHHFDKEIQKDMINKLKFRMISSGFLESLSRLWMDGGQSTPDVFSLIVFVSSFKVAPVCFRMVELSTNLDTY